jgi:hypothetical protein
MAPRVLFTTLWAECKKSFRSVLAIAKCYQCTTPSAWLTWGPTAPTAQLHALAKYGGLQIHPGPAPVLLNPASLAGAASFWLGNHQQTVKFSETLPRYTSHSPQLLGISGED